VLVIRDLFVESKSTRSVSCSSIDGSKVPRVKKSPIISTISQAAPRGTQQHYATIVETHLLK
jgi:hypothetical protein